MDRLEQVGRRAEAHEIARPRIGVEDRHRDVERRVALGRRLVAGEPADADPVERQRRDVSRRLGPEVLLEPALDDPEQRLVRPAVGGERSFGPAVRPLGRIGDDGARRRRRDRLVKRDRDVRAERLLDGDRVLRRESMERAVEMASERHAIVGDDAKVAERDDLVAARIGEDRPIPRP